MSAQQHQAQLVSSTPRLKSHDPGLSVEGPAAPRRHLPVPASLWLQRASAQSRGAAETAAGLGVFSPAEKHLREMSTLCGHGKWRHSQRPGAGDTHRPL